VIERQIEKRLREEIKKLGGRSYKFVSPGNDGVPDRIVVKNGKVWFVELKTVSGQVSPIQAVQLARLREVGADARVLHGWDEARAFVEEVSRA